MRALWKLLLAAMLLPLLATAASSQAVQVIFPKSSEGLAKTKWDATQTAEALRKVGVIGVFCGDDADARTCQYFSVALRKQLQGKTLVDGPRYSPEVPFLIAQSFYIPMMLPPYPSVQATLRLIEDDSPNGETRLYVSGFCFSYYPDSMPVKQRLPQWDTLLEGSSGAGPLDSDKAAAAVRLAKAVSVYVGNAGKSFPLQERKK